MKISLVISHTPWIPERVESMGRLMSQLGSKQVLGHKKGGGEELRGYTTPLGFHSFSIVQDKAPNHEWSEVMWSWASSQDVDWCLFLQDDAVLAPDFLARLCELLEHPRGPVIGLQVAHPSAPALYEEGCSWFTTSDALVGVGYAVHRATLRMFLDWRANALKEGALEAITEDSLLGLFCMVMGTKVAHPLPTIVDHDTNVASVYQNDSHPHRHSRVRWDVRPREAVSTRIPHVGRFYHSSADTARTWVKGLTDAQYLALKSDNGQREARRVQYARRARDIEPKAKVLIATPTRGGVHPEYAATIWRILRDEEIDTESTLEIHDVQQWSADVVRVRSRFMQYFRTQTDATHILYLDADIDMLPKVLRGMLAANRDFVACPYPKRDAVDFEKVRRGNPRVPPEALAYRYSVRTLKDATSLAIDVDNCVEVESMPLGCALISRVGVERLAAYKFQTEPCSHCGMPSDEDLSFEDDAHGPAEAFFQLRLRDRHLYSEDYSFCERWRESGQKVFAYLGEGSPVNHWGEHGYKGAVEAFGFTRIRA